MFSIICFPNKWLLLSLLSMLFGLSVGTVFGEYPDDEYIVVRAAVPMDFPPQYQTDESGRPAGFAIEVMDHVAELAKFKVIYITMSSWTEVDEALSNGEVDFIPNLGITAQRQERFDFSIPMETYPVSLFIRDESSNIKGIEDLSGRTVAVVKYNVAENLLKDQPGVVLKISQNAKEALFELLSGNVDAFAFPEPAIVRLAKDIGVDKRLRVIGTPLTEIKRGVALRKGNAALLSRFNVAINDFIKTPMYKDIYVKWHGTLQPNVYWSTQRIFLTVASISTLIIIAVVVWRFISLKRLNGKLNTSILAQQKAEEELNEYKLHLELQVEERTNELECINQELESYSYSIAHDLRAPLRTITSFSQIILDDAAGKLTDDDTKNFHRVINAAKYMAKLIDDILKLSKITRADPVKNKVDISAMCRDILELLHEVEPEKDISWNIEPGVIARADSSLMRLLYDNLLGNAWKYSKEEYAQIDIGMMQRNGVLEYFVRDNGVGIDMQFSDKIFLPFHRLNADKNIEGSGIGLAIAKRIVERHGGEIRVESELHKGTTIYFSL